MQILGLSIKDLWVKSTGEFVCHATLMQHSTSQSYSKPSMGPGALGDCTETLPEWAPAFQISSTHNLPSHLKSLPETWSKSELTEMSPFNIHSKIKMLLLDQNMRYAWELQLLQGFGTCIYLLTGKRDRSAAMIKACSSPAPCTHKCRQLLHISTALLLLRSTRRRQDISHELVLFTNIHFVNQRGDRVLRVPLSILLSVLLTYTGVATALMTLAWRDRTSHGGCFQFQNQLPQPSCQHHSLGRRSVRLRSPLCTPWEGNAINRHVFFLIAKALIEEGLFYLFYF